MFIYWANCKSSLNKNFPTARENIHLCNLTFESNAIFFIILFYLFGEHI